MTFLQPQFLYGLLALAIPVVIHLFDFRRTKKVYFSDTRFLNQVKESTSSLYRLKHLLILITRLLFIGLLVLAFAQPYIPTGNGEGLSARTVGLYLDNSLSMSNEVDDEFSGLDQAKQVASEIVRLYPSDTEFRLITDTHFSAPKRSVGRKEVLDQIAALDFAESHRQLADIVDLMTEEKLLREIYLISDFQLSTNDSRIESKDSLAKFFLIPVSFRSMKNVYIDTVFVDNPFVLEKEKVVLKAAVQNTGLEEVKDMPIKLYLNDRQISATTINLDPASSIEVSFDLGFGLEKSNLGTIALEDYPVVFDNDFYFNLNLGRKINILEVKGDEGTDYVKEVYGNPDLFNFSRTYSNNVDYSLIQPSDLIVLNELKSLTPGLLTRLTEFVNAGGSILVVPSPEVQTRDFGSLAPGIRPRQVSESYSLGNPDFRLPFFSNILIDESERLEMPTAKPVWAWGTDRNAFLTLQDGSPFLSQVRKGVVVMSAPLQQDYSTLSQHALYVPIMYRLAAVTGIKDQPLFYRLDNAELTLRVDSVQRDQRIELSNNDTEIIPDQFISGKSIYIGLTGSLLRAGHYSLNAGQNKLADLAFNNSVKESQVRSMSPTQIREKFGAENFDFYEGGSAEEVAEKLSNKYKGISLWRYALSLSLLFLFLEVLFIRLL